MVSRGYRVFLIWSVLIVSLIAGGASLSHANELNPSLKFEWIDEDGTVVPTDWQSQAAWNWNDQKLVLQIWFEVPKHLTATLPAPLTKKIAPPQTKAPFKLSPDHVLIVMQLEQQAELFRFEESRNRFLRISALTSKTNWMRHPSCKEASPYLEEVQVPETGGPFFIALTCRGRAQDDTAWIDVASSSDSTVEIEPLGKAKQKTNSVLMAMPVPGSKTQDRKLAVLRFRDSNGDVMAVYNLNANPAPIETPIAVANAEDKSAGSAAIDSAKSSFSARMGFHIQFVRSGEAQDGRNRMGTNAGEFAISLQAHTRRFAFDLVAPVRRLGTGLNSGSPADTFGTAYLGYKPAADSPTEAKSISLSLGLQASLLDSRLDTGRVSTASISPALELSYDRRHSITIAPVDLRSDLASLRTRFQFPLGKRSRYALSLDAFGARSFGQGHDGWYVVGSTLGFTGGF